ncbi:hypothetical protein HK405_014505 [Cladochytrium tenue]|nr:hypothetical protein HK405_014505 [Cladochytrium tenue]
MRDQQSVLEGHTSTVKAVAVSTDNLIIKSTDFSGVSIHWSTVTWIKLDDDTDDDSDGDYDRYSDDDLDDDTDNFTTIDYYAASTSSSLSLDGSQWLIQRRAGLPQGRTWLLLTYRPNFGCSAFFGQEYFAGANESVIMIKFRDQPVGNQSVD